MHGWFGLGRSLASFYRNRRRIRANCFKERLQFDREGGMEVEQLAGLDVALGVSEGKMSGVEEVAGEL